jgi:hypothetical protein
MRLNSLALAARRDATARRWCAFLPECARGTAESLAEASEPPSRARLFIGFPDDRGLIFI